VVSSTIPHSGKLLVVINGEYGRRMLSMAKVHNINATTLKYADNEQQKVSDIKKKNYLRTHNSLMLL